MLKYRSGEAVYFRERILRRDKQAVWKGWVHEAIEPFGNITYEDITILHKKEKPSSGSRNLDIYRKMQQAGETFSPRDTFYFARELYYNGLYKEAIEGFDRVIASPHAWIENKISACEHRADCLLALQEGEESKRSLLTSFLFSPRAELICKLGGIYM
ncbi:MAG: glycosyl transferase, partial [Clostridia bacterium]|nr:glycosyl transferase [Clostridia bacterium]